MSKEKSRQHDVVSIAAVTIITEDFSLAALFYASSFLRFFFSKTDS